MKIGVVSDTHRNKEILETALDWLISRQHIEALYHLGDEYEDVLDIAGRGVPVVQVPGIYDARYLSGALKPQQMENVLGLRILLVHSFDKDVTRQDKTVSDIILYGHSHKAEIAIIDGLLLMNPGHLKSEMDKHFKPSFGLLDIQENTVSARIFDLDFTQVHGVNLMRSERGLYRT